MKIAIYTLTSALHDAEAVGAAASAFIDGIERAWRDGGMSDMEFELKGKDYSDYGTHALDVIYVRTGGTEGLFKDLFDKGIIGEKPVYLLTSGKSNSLAASMEILSFLVGQGRRGEIIHGSSEHIARRIALLTKLKSADNFLCSSRLGVIGKPSDWLISSNVDYCSVKELLGIELVDIEMSELLEEIAKKEYPMNAAVKSALDYAAGGNASYQALPGHGGRNPEKYRQAVADSVEGALYIYGALERIVDKYNLSGLTLRCFDLLTAVGNTGCLALAILNSEGIPAGCEGDVPALISMAVTKALVGVSGFQANPSRIDPERGEILFAHCTVPLNMVRSYCFDTHFESGIGVAVHGEIPEGGVTIFKLAADLSRYSLTEAELVSNGYQEDLCRTQVLLKSKCDTNIFLKRPAGNHHIIIPGRHEELFRSFMDYRIA